MRVAGFPFGVCGTLVDRYSLRFNLHFLTTLARWLEMPSKHEKTEEKELAVIIRELILVLHTQITAANEAHKDSLVERKLLKEIVQLLTNSGNVPAKGFKIVQNGGIMQADITGIVKGQVGNFSSTTDPTGSLLQPGNVPVFTSDNPLTTMTPSADGFSVAVATSVDDPETSFNLTESGVNSLGTPISTTINVPLTVAAVPASGFNIRQIS